MQKETGRVAVGVQDAVGQSGCWSKEPVMGDSGSCAGNSDHLSGIQISTFITEKETGPGG